MRVLLAAGALSIVAVAGAQAPDPATAASLPA